MEGKEQGRKRSSDSKERSSSRVSEEEAIQSIGAWNIEILLELLEIFLQYDMEYYVEHAG